MNSIELYLGFAPDGGDGSVELALVLVAICVVAALAMARRRRRGARTQPGEIRRSRNWIGPACEGR
jgi:hypothetical protein